MVSFFLRKHANYANCDKNQFIWQYAKWYKPLTGRTKLWCHLYTESKRKTELRAELLLLASRGCINGGSIGQEACNFNYTEWIGSGDINIATWLLLIIEFYVHEMY